MRPAIRDLPPGTNAGGKAAGAQMRRVWPLRAWLIGWLGCQNSILGSRLVARIAFGNLGNEIEDLAIVSGAKQPQILRMRPQQRICRAGRAAAISCSLRAGRLHPRSAPATNRSRSRTVPSRAGTVAHRGRPQARSGRVRRSAAAKPGRGPTSRRDRRQAAVRSHHGCNDASTDRSVCPLLGLASTTRRLSSTNGSFAARIP